MNVRLQCEMRRGFEVPVHEGDNILAQYRYDLPHDLIAARPNALRDQCKLMMLSTDGHGNVDSISHGVFADLSDLLTEQTILVLNESAVFPCRLAVEKETGGKGEIFFLQKEAREDFVFKALIKSNSKKNPEQKFLASKCGDVCVLVKNRDLSEEGSTFLVQVFYKNELVSNLAQIEHLLEIPIPPYIRKGESDEQDRVDYQTVYAKNSDADKMGSVAAPTAGLHFTPELLNKLKSKGVTVLTLRLHVGLGTFLPIKTDTLSDHKMHREFYSIDLRTQKKLQEAYRQNKKIIAVGTTTLRALESWYRERATNDCHADFFSSTDIFIRPGEFVQSIDGLITNFHLSESSLLVLVSALIGRANTMRVYKLAKEMNYRFFSYGDAMLIGNWGNRVEF